MPNYLQEFRDHFNCSQEGMAASLGVSIRTISRWERAHVPATNPFHALVWSTVNRYSAHLCRYATALLPSDLIDDVRWDQRERSLLVGPQAVVLAMSEGTRRNWGVYRFFEGISVAGFMKPEMKTMLAGYYDAIRDVTVPGGSAAAIHLVTKDAPAGSTPPLWRKHTISAVYPLVLDMVSHPITEQEFHETTPKFWGDAAIDC